MKFPSSLLSFVILLALACCLGASPALQQSSLGTNSQENISAVQISTEEKWAHQGADHHPIRVANRKSGGIFETVEMEIHVDPGGSVISAKPVSGPSELFATAVSQAKNWKYTPFERDGAPVYAAFDEYISILPPEDLPKDHVPFPAVSTLAGVQMKLERSGCFGACPAYSVEIKGDGTVVYNGEGYVVITGEHRAHISESAVSEILDAFRKADYFSLRDRYDYMVTDNPTYRTSLAIDNVTKSVTDYVGLEAGMPQAVSDLEETIDRVAGTLKWIKGTSDAVSSLRAEGWNFKSAEASSVLARASREGSTSFVHDLLVAGVSSTGGNSSEGNPLTNSARRGDRATVQMLIQADAAKSQPQEKNDALVAAARSGDLQLVRMLIEYGADPASQDRYGETPLMSAASSGQPDVVAEILKHHADIAAHDLEGRTVIHAAAEYDDDKEGERAVVIRMLAKAGADLNAQDNAGKTALHKASEKVARELIKSGANLDIRDRKGETPLMSTYSLSVTKLLLEAGANPSVRDNDGETALDRAKQSGPPEKFQILEAALKQKDKS